MRTDANLKEIVQRLKTDDLHGGPWRQSKQLPTPESVWIFVLYFADDDALAGLELRQRQELTMSQCAFARRDRMAMRVFERLTQMGGDGLLHARRDGVFQCLSFGIDLAPIQPKNSGQKQFNKSMPADDAPGFRHAPLRKPSAHAG